LFVCYANCIHYTPLLGNESSKESFDGYAKFFNKTYSPSELRVAYKNFVASIGIVAELNAKYGVQGTIYGLTQFSDLSAAEFKNTVLMKTLIKNYKAPNQTVPPPGSYSSIDWVSRGKTTPVKNQGHCGSCWTFSATETIESANIIAGRISSGTALAPQEIVDCDSGGAGCGGGWPAQAMRWVVSKGGLATEASYPYRGYRGSCSRGRVGATISSVVDVSGYESSVMSALGYCPLSVCVDASAWQHYSGGILQPSHCGHGIDHAVQLTGYNPGSGGYWIIRNSWGSGWGNGGFIYLRYGYDTCGITSSVSYCRA